MARIVRLAEGNPRVAQTARAAADVAVDGDPRGVVWLLGSLREAGAHEQHTTLADRLPAAGQFDTFLDIEDHRDRFAFGREPDGSPAAPWTWDDLQ